MANTLQSSDGDTVTWKTHFRDLIHSYFETSILEAHLIFSELYQQGLKYSDFYKSDARTGEKRQLNIAIQHRCGHIKTRQLSGCVHGVGLNQIAISLPVNNIPILRTNTFRIFF